MSDKEKTVLLFLLFAVVGFFLAWQWRQGGKNPWAGTDLPVRNDDSAASPEDYIPPSPTNVSDYTAYNLIWRSTPPVATTFPGGARFANNGGQAPAGSGSCQTCSAVNKLAS